MIIGKNNNINREMDYKTYQNIKNKERTLTELLNIFICFDCKGPVVMHANKFQRIKMCRRYNIQ